MAENKPKTTPLPEDLREQIELFKKKLWRIKITEAVLAGIFGLLISFIIILAVERVWEIPPWLRIVNLIIGFSTFSIFAPIWINRWVFKHRREKQLARLISQKFPRLGDRILGVVELENQNGKLENVSDELRAAAMLSVAEEAKKRDFSQALPNSWQGKWVLGVLGCIAAVAVGCVLIPKDGIIATVKRWLTPWEDTERFTFVKINTDPYKDGHIVAINEDFDIPVTLHKDSRKEGKGSAQFGSEAWQTEKFNGEVITFPFKKKLKKGKITLKIGDAEEQINLIPLPRPSIKKSYAIINEPAYLNRSEPRRVEITGGIVEALEGSEVRIVSEANRNLSSASVGQIMRRAYEEEQIEGEDETRILVNNLEINATPKGSFINIGPFAMKKDKLFLPLTWTDTYGLKTKQPAEFEIRPIADLAPEAFIESEKEDFIHLIGKPFNFKALFNDDLGIKAAGYMWQGEHFGPAATAPARGEKLLYLSSEGETKEQAYEKNITSSNDIQNIKIPQSLTIHAWVEDQLPGRGRILSERTIVVHLYSKPMIEEGNIEKIKEFQNDIDEILERSLENKENTEILKHLLEKANEDAKSSDKRKADQARKKAAELTEKIGDLKGKEKEQEDDIKDLSQKVEDLFNEAAMDKTLSPDALKKLKELQNNLDKASQAKKSAQKNMQKAKENQSKQNQKNQQKPQNKENQDSEESQKDIENAQQDQKEAEEALQEASKNAEKTRENEKLASFVNRLKKAAADERAVANNIVELAQKHAEGDVELSIWGEGFNSRLDSQKQTLYTTFMMQGQVKVDLGWIYEDLIEYYARTQKEGLDKVIEAMENVARQGEGSPTNSENGMENILHDLDNSRWFDSTRYARGWADEIDRWAKLLSKAGGGGGSGSGSGSGGPKINDDDFNFLLRVMEMVKKEQDIRDHTRAMEQDKRSLELNNRKNSKP